MSNKTIVMVSDLDDAGHGAIHVLSNSREGARLVETLLEAGFEQDRIRVFAGEEMEMQITHRPVVALVTNGVGTEPDHPQAEDAIADEAEEGEELQPERRPEPEPALTVFQPQPYIRNGVRFSTLFRPAYS